MAKPLKKILCVDDENDIRQVAKIALENVGGFEVELCSSGQEALAKAEQVNPDLILLDYMMPQMDGPATLTHLRKNQAWKLIPIVFMTARVQPKEIEEYLAIGASGVISKPFDPMTLSQEVTLQWVKFHTARKDAFDALMVPLRKEFLGNVKEAHAALLAARDDLRAGTLPPGQVSALLATIHHLAGSGTTYGFETVTTTAQHLELVLKKEGDSDVEKLGPMFDALIDACGKALQS